MSFKNQLKQITYMTYMLIFFGTQILEIKEIQISGLKIHRKGRVPTDMRSFF
ncbi:hypothetical protein FUMI01_14760 [Flavobacterium sp. UMI-01]|nr:hypothetical protein FUMI01_14760 [Flavobacterium sp. UMI-01]